MMGKFSATSSFGALLALSLGATLALVGCTRGPVMVPVSGEVSFAGEKIVEGQIVFADTAATNASHAAPIVDGRYALDVTPGEKLVRITASKETGKMISGGMDMQIPERVDIIPPEFNVQSNLHRQVHADGRQTLDFHLPIER